MKLVILGRDGTVNERGADIVDTADAWRPLPGALEAIARLNHAGWHVVVASNQDGLGRGLFEVAALNAIHARMHRMLAAVGGRVDAVFYCPHAPEDGCRCRKPEPGLLEQIGERFAVELSGIPVVGDSLDDMLASASAGCESHLVLTGRTRPAPGEPLAATFPPATMVHDDLAAFAHYLVNRPAVQAAPRHAAH